MLLPAAMWLSAYAQSADAVVSSGKHEVRVGWGDMMFESVAFPDDPNHAWADVEKLPNNYVVTEECNHRYTGHIFADYHYNVLHWLAVGGQFDFEGIFWNEVTYSKYHYPVGEITDIRNYNIVLMPTVRFTYFHSQWVNLYSGIGFGMNIACDNSGRAEVAPAFFVRIFTLIPLEAA